VQAASLAKRRGSTPLEDRRITLDGQSLPGGNPAPNDLGCRRMTAAINIALHRAAAPPHIRIEPVKRSAKGNLTAAAVMGADASMLLFFKEAILQTSRSHDQDIAEVRANENWQRLETFVPAARTVSVTASIP